MRLSMSHSWIDLCWCRRSVYSKVNTDYETEVKYLLLFHRINISSWHVYNKWNHVHYPHVKAIVDVEFAFKKKMIFYYPKSKTKKFLNFWQLSNARRLAQCCLNRINSSAIKFCSREDFIIINSRTIFYSSKIQQMTHFRVQFITQYDLFIL